MAKHSLRVGTRFRPINPDTILDLQYTITKHEPRSEYYRVVSSEGDEHTDIHLHTIQTYEIIPMYEVVLEDSLFED
jgi:hypothetical protein